MTAIYSDASLADDARRERLYQGQLFVYSPCPSSRALCIFAREMIEEAFHPLDPREAQDSLPVEEYATILAKLKPAFIHHSQSKEFIQGILRETGCDLNKTYFDVPRMRTATHSEYLTSGIAYAFHPHRDTWYSAPACQINWWMPLYEIEPENAMAFHLRYWNQAVRNGSDEYNYAEWNRANRFTAAQHIKADTRKQPHPEEPIDLDPQIRVITKAGGILLFSAAQLHSTVPNTSRQTRFSIDFRTVHIDDVIAKKGAPNIDSACTGTTMGDYLRGTDLLHIPEEIVLLYDTKPPANVASLRPRRQVD
jgi:hypothetical protein